MTEERIQRLSTEQTTVGKSIFQLFDNFRKERVERRTLESAQVYQQKLAELWTTFSHTHGQLLELEVDENHPYFQKDFYKQVKDVYEACSARITERIQEAMENASNKDPDRYLEPGTPDVLKCKRRLKSTISSLGRIISTTEEEIRTQQSRAYYSQRLDYIKQYWEQLTYLHGQIIAELDDEIDEEGEYAQIEDRFQTIAIKLQEGLDEITSSGSIKVKLPEIVLPIFDGSYTKWKQFKDLFTQLIHNRPLGSAEKMYYLKANLTGEPSRLVKHLQATGNNYFLAWKILVDRYDNTRTIMSAVLNELLSQPTVTASSSSGIKRIHDTTKECLLTLQNMGIKVKEWSPILLHLLLQKLDKESRVLYEQSLKSPRELQDTNEFLAFLELRFQMLEVVQVRTHSKNSVALTTSFSKNQCPVCSLNHKVFKCEKFLYSPIDTRIQMVKQHKLCQNCLKPNHKGNQCPSKGCLKCNGRHNTLIHSSRQQSSKSDTQQQATAGLPTLRQPQGTPIVRESAVINQPRPSTSKNLSLSASSKSHVLLATAVVKVISPSGNSQPCRVLLDSGSQVHFIRENIVQLLGLKRRKVSLPINGIGGLETLAKYETTFTIRSRMNNFAANITAIILPKISDYQPATYLNAANWNIPAHIQLADPGFFKPQAIDMLLGAALYFELLQDGKISLGNKFPLLQNTQLGWVLSGMAEGNSPERCYSHIATQPSLTAIDKQLQQFWELEQHDSPSKYNSKEENDCELHFETTFERSPSGRYVVQLPFREQPSSLGQSLEMATKRFYALERRLERNPNLKTQYCEFMREYQALGHMQPIPRNLIPVNHYYMPHHCVIKADSSTTKLRVVFDASAKTSSGKSLNDILMVGPTVQPDLFAILTKFRLHKYVMTADICKMYRQIEVHPNDRRFQLILWREDKKNPLQAYQLNTVTYGTAAAPFLATRCLNQLAYAESDESPEAANVILNNTYVDDILTGANSMQTMLKLKEELVQMLRRGGFELRKFCSNQPNLLRDIPEEHKEKMLLLNDAEVTKALGLIWQPSEDVFQYQSTAYEPDKITKRTVLSDVARIFDPLGLIGPTTVLGKIFLQELWKAKISWDDELSPEYKEKWIKFKKGLSGLSKLKIQRHLLISNAINIQLHAFSDSSEAAYGACCYIRSVDNHGQIRVRLLGAKSKLAPLKTTTLARLELCAAVLMAEFVDRILQCIQIKLSKIVYYTDSTTVLSWIATPSYLLRTFVGNRVEKIQQLTQQHQWKHIDGIQNPADIISRGMAPNTLSQSSLWFKGPSFLSEAEEYWPNNQFKPSSDIPETKLNKSVLSAAVNATKYSDIISPVNHSNSFPKLQRIFALCMRFVHNCKSTRAHRRTDDLTIPELDMALNGIIKNVQRTAFHQDYTCLKKRGSLDCNNSLQKLAPYIDKNNGIIRVGGRLNLSELGPDAKNQILLPKSNKFGELLFSHLHKQHMHAGPQTLTAIARQKYWIINAKRLAIKTVHQCMRCFRSKPQLADQIMGNLPKERVMPARPFRNTGIDSCGPIMVHHDLRGKRPTKAYIAVFVCFATKAVHLELVSNLTTEAFLNALKRFIARRGLCATIFCDNATNFVGARAELQELKNMFNSKELQAPLSKFCHENHIEWKPTPPRSPHFGGLWEAAVKSAKKHLIRQVGNASLNKEDLHTVIVQIEAILNSRPITPLSSDPNDLEALTPGHFLTGGPLTSFAEPDVSDRNLNSLTRYQHIQHIQQNFWKRWSTEYLQELQTRHKWKAEKPNLRPGTLVLIREANLPALKWPLGRVIETFDGADGLTRVANVKTASGVYKRSIHNLCPLPEEVYPKDERRDEPKSNEGEKIQSNLCLRGAEQLPTTSRGNRNEEPPAKRPNPRRPSHPLRGRFCPINPNWIDSPNLHARHSSLSSSKPKDGQKNITASTTLKLLMLTSLIMPLSGLPIPEPVEIVPFDNHPGIFFEKLGQTQLISSEWSIITYYNLSNYWTELKGIQRCINTLETLCNTTTLRKNHCLETLYQFQHELTQIEATNEILHKSGGGGRILHKRSPFDIIGNVANKLFGILDASYAEFIEQEIEKTQANQGHMMQLLKNQTSILEATTNVMKRRDEAIQQQFEAIHEHMLAYNKLVNDVQQEQQAMHSFTALSTLTTLILQNYHRIQDALLTVLTNVHHDKISPLLITPMQLRRQIALIKEHIPSTLTVPGTGQDGVSLIYNLMTVGVRVTESYIVCDIRLPLQLDDHFQLFKLIPVPIPRNDKLFLIRPSTEYLIVSLSRERHYPVTEQELGKCRQLNEEEYLCKQNHPILNLKANTSQCEMNLLNHHHSLSPTCELRTLTSSNLWIQLHTPNNWLYYLDHETTFNIVCGTAVTPRTLKGSGTLKLRPDCSMKQTTMTITGHGRYASKIVSSFVPRINFSDLLDEHLNKTHRQSLITIPELHLQTNEREFEALTNKIKDLKQAEILPKTITSHDIHHYAISYILLVSLICGVSYYILYRWRHSKRIYQQPSPLTYSKTPAPAKRTQPRTEDFVLPSNPRGQDV